MTALLMVFGSQQAQLCNSLTPKRRSEILAFCFLGWTWNLCQNGSRLYDVKYHIFGRKKNFLVHINSNIPTKKLSGTESKYFVIPLPLMCHSSSLLFLSHLWKPFLFFLCGTEGSIAGSLSSRKALNVFRKPLMPQPWPMCHEPIVVLRPSRQGNLL